MKKRSPIHAYKRLLARDQDWDYAFLIALEKKKKKKLQRMHDYFKHDGHLENNDIVARDIAICIRLIDIFMEDYAAYYTWLNNSYTGELKWRKQEDDNYELDDSDRKPIANFPVYVNVTNDRRFLHDTPIKNAQQEGDRDSAQVIFNNQKDSEKWHY